MKQRRARLGRLIGSLRGRFLFLICLATLPAVLFTFVVAQNERHAALARMERDALHLAALTSREHAHQIRGARELLAWLGATLTPDGPNPPRITDPGFLRALLAGHPQLANIGVLSPDGDVTASAYPLSNHQTWKDNPIFRAAIASKTVVAGSYVISPIFERPTLNHAFAVRGPNDEVLAVLFDGLDLEWLSKLARENYLPGDVQLMITDAQGQVLAHGGADDAGPQRRQIANIADLAQSQRGQIRTLTSTAQPRYFVAAPLEEGSKLFVAVSLSHTRIIRDANSTFYRTLAALGILTFFVIAAVFVAAELGILHGLRSLARAAQRLRDGDFTARAHVPRGHDEFAALATAFNAMADSIVARHDDALAARARMRELAGRLHSAREMEAARISRELHDEIGQLLSSLKIDLSHLDASCGDGDGPPPCRAVLREHVAEMIGQIAAALEFVRRISSELRPGVLDRLGLMAALEWQAREIERRTGLTICVDGDDPDPQLDEIVAVTLYRIACEALTNVVRHAAAHTVEIDLETDGREIGLTIRDDGKGIPHAAIDNPESIGIVGMRERAMLIDGRLTIDGAPGVGTTVRVRVPTRTFTEPTHANPAG